MTSLDSWELAAIALALLAFSAVSRRLERSVVTPAIFFTAAGLLAGPVFGLIDLRIEGEPLKLLVEATLTLILFADASRISFPALRSQFAVPARLLGIGLPLTIAAGTLVGVTVLPGVSLVEALVLSIMLACTDAALGQAVVTDERIPSRIRQGLNVESGLNDGICVPLFFIALAVAEWDAGTVTAHAAAHLVLEEIGYGLVAGVAAGVLGAVALRVASRRSLVEPHWLQILTAATALLAAGIATGLGGSIFIAAFTGGFLFGLIGRDSGGEVSYLVDEGGELLNAVTFVVFGAAILGPALDEMGWEVLVYAVLSLTAVRMLPVALALIGTGARRQTIAFVGWFGPRGLATIVFAVILIDESSLPHERTLLLAVVATIGISVLAHGLTARPLTNRYVGWYASHPRDDLPAMESAPAASHRWRKPQAPVGGAPRTEPG
ncbi:MAG: cation:proton antiporter [Gaiellaceae bacterium]